MTNVFSRSIRFSVALIYSACHILWVSEGVFGQTSIKLPKTGGQSPQSLEILPSQSPPPTFTEENPVPSGYSPPVYSEEESRQFQLYRLDVGDGVGINLPDFPEFNSSTAVDPEGNIELPVLGRIPAVGLTLTELENKIQYELYKKYLKEEPRVIAVLTSPRPVQLTIIGEVIRPGFYSLAPNTPLTSVLLTAGGSTSEADLRAVIVRRVLVDGTTLEEKVDLYTPLVEGSSLPDFRLQGGDTVIVSRLAIGENKGYDQQLIARTTLTQPTITIRLLVPVQPSGVAFRNVTLPNGSNFLDIVASFPVTDWLRINQKEIALLRFDPDKGGIVTQNLNPEAAIRGDISQNIPLRDQDVVIVSRTLLGKVLAAFNVITQPIRDIFGFTNTLVNFSDQLNRFNN